MKTLTNSTDSVIGEFTYEGCKYPGIEANSKFSVMSDNLVDYLLETFSFLIEAEEVAPVVASKGACRKCGRDCKNEYMRDRHEKVCTEPDKDGAPLLTPNYIYWNYRGLDRSQIPVEMLKAQDPDYDVNSPQETVLTEEEVSQPAPGVKGTAMIGKRQRPVVTDHDGVDWYGDGVQDDIA